MKITSSHHPSLLLSTTLLYLTTAFHNNIALHNNQKTNFKLAQQLEQELKTNECVESSSSSSQAEDEIFHLIDLESERQRNGLELIASENFVSKDVRRALGSRLTNKYSEGMVGKRYYGGNEYIDKIESLCQKRALELYNLSSEDWCVNVQPYSGSPANFAVYTALLQPHDRIMGLDLPSGGHLTHGYVTKKGKRISAASVYFESMPYVVDATTGLIDYDDLRARAKMFQPKLLIAGASAYPREWDYKKMREIANEVNAILMTDMSHISGLVATSLAESPFRYSDIVTTTTHKTLRGPRSGMIFSKKEYSAAIDTAVFPMLQGGPHNHQIAAVAIALQEAMTDQFRLYASRVIENARVLARELMERGHVIVTNGTDNHIVLWNVRDVWGLTGFMVERTLECVGITVNKNSIFGDVSAVNPGGVRLGTPALTTRGFQKEDFRKVAEFLHDGCMLALEIRDIAVSDKEGSKVTMKEFLEVLEGNEMIQDKIGKMKNEVELFASSFPLP